MSLQEMLVDGANRISHNASTSSIDAQVRASRDRNKRNRRNSRLALIASRRDVVAGGEGDGDSSDSDGYNSSNASVVLLNELDMEYNMSSSHDKSNVTDRDPTTISKPSSVTTAAGSSSSENESTAQRAQRKDGKTAKRRSSPQANTTSTATNMRRRSIQGSAPLAELQLGGALQPKSDKGEKGSLTDGKFSNSGYDADIIVPEGPAEIEDLTEILNPTHERVIEVLEERHRVGLIYTTVGDCLISINPYRWIGALYKPETIEAHLTPSSEAGAKKYPHVYQVASDALMDLQSSGINQSIVIAGESGSGKTENMKKCLQFFTRISCDPRQSHSGHQSSIGSSTELERMILATNPLIEAFGNARTVRNGNSSRFGRWIEITFLDRETIVGCSCTSYLLEKSRVTMQQEGDRNFHIFYMMIAGADDAQFRRYSLMPIEKFNYLRTSLPIGSQEQDISRFADFMDAARDTNLDEDELHNLLHCAASCLHLGNVRFDIVDRGSCKVHTPTAHEVDDSEQGHLADALAVVSKMLGVDANELSTALCFRTIQMRSSGEEMQVPMSQEKAVSARDALAKSMYARLFFWLVARLNKTFPSLTTSETKAERVSSVGMLDIFGFEIMASNNFEQLCINYTNEKLQHFFNQYVFTKEVKLYAQEGLVVQEVEFTGNSTILQLFEKRGIGLLALLDEELIRPSGNDKSFCRKTSQKNAKHQNYSRSRFSDLEFTIKHFAGDVTYQADGFLEKNRDRLQENLVSCMRTSNENFIANVLFAVGADGGKVRQLPNPSGNNGKSSPISQARHTVATGRRKTHANKVANSIASQLRGSVNSLIHKLESTRPHFIRCIKPNSSKSALEFNQEMVLHQLKCLGVIEAIQAQQRGYPIRLSHKNFAQRYRICGLSGSRQTSTQVSNLIASSNFLKACHTLIDGGLRDLDDGKLKDVFIGKTMVLYRPVHREFLEALRRRGQRRAVVLLQCAARLQRAAKDVKSRRELKVKLKDALNNFSNQIEDINRLRRAVKGALDINGMKERPWSEITEAKKMLRVIEKRAVVADTLRQHLEVWGVDPSNFQSLSEKIRSDKGVTKPSEAGRISDCQSDKFLSKLEYCLAEASKVDLGIVAFEKGDDRSPSDNSRIDDKENVNLIEAAKSVYAAARERCFIRSEVQEALRIATRVALLNAVETIRVGASKYGEEFIEEELHSVNQMLKYIDEEKQHVTALREGLASTGVRGAVGRLDTSRIQFSELQEAIQRCSHTVLKTVQAQCLLRVARALYDVRLAVSIDDWEKCYVAFDQLLGSIEAISTLVGGRIDSIGIPPSAAGEIEILSEEVKERRFCESVENVLLEGRITGTTGNLDCSQMNSRQLMDMLSGAQENIASPRGNSVLILAQKMLELRVAVCKGNWEAVAEILPVARIQAVLVSDMNAPKSEKVPTSHGGKKTFGISLKDELELFQAQLEYEAQIRLLVSALNDGAILNLHFDPIKIDLRQLDASIEQGAACRFRAITFSRLISAARRTRDIRACLRANDWTALERLLDEIQNDPDHRNIVPRMVLDEIGIVQLALKCHKLEVQACGALKSRKVGGEYSSGYANLLNFSGIRTPEIVDEWATPSSIQEISDVEVLGSMSDKEESSKILQEFCFAAHRLEQKTKTVEKLLWTVDHILRLRNALSNGHWQEAKQVLNNVSNGDFEIVDESLTEVREAERKVINLEIAAALEHGLKTGVISMSKQEKGRIDKNSIGYALLEKALSRAGDVDDSIKHTRVLELERVCDFMMNVRKLVWEGEWAKCEEFIAEPFETAETRIRKSDLMARASVEKGSRGLPLRTLLGERIRYPLVHDEVRRVQTEIARRYICERMLRAISQGSLRDFIIEVGVSTDADSRASGSLRPANQRNVRWKCAWTETEKHFGSLSTGNYAMQTQEVFKRLRRLSVGSQILNLAIKDNEKTRPSLETSYEAAMTGTGVSVSLADLRGALLLANAFKMSGDGDKLIQHTAKVIYNLRKALREGDEIGIASILRETEEGRILQLAQNEVRIVSEGMQCLRIIRKICSVLGQGKAGKYEDVRIAPLEHVLTEARTLVARLEGHQDSRIEKNFSRESQRGYNSDIMSFLSSDASWRDESMQRLDLWDAYTGSNRGEPSRFFDPYTNSLTSASRQSSIAGQASGRKCIHSMICCAEILLQLRHAYLKDDIPAVRRFCEELGSLQLHNGPASIVEDEVFSVQRFILSRTVRNKLCAALLSGYAKCVRKRLDTESMQFENAEITDMMRSLGPIDLSTINTVHLEEAIISAERFEAEDMELLAQGKAISDSSARNKLLTHRLVYVARFVLQLRHHLKCNNIDLVRKTLSEAERDLPDLTDSILEEDSGLEDVIRSVLFECLSARKELEFQGVLSDLNLCREAGRKALDMVGNDMHALKHRANAVRKMCNDGMSLLDRKLMEGGMKECSLIGMEVENADAIRRLLALPDSRFNSLKLQAAVSNDDSKMVGKVVANIMQKNHSVKATTHRRAEEYISLKIDRDPRLKHLLHGWLGRRGVSYPISCLHDLIGAGVLGHGDKIFALWIACLTESFGKGQWNFSEEEARKAWAGFSACLSFVPVGVELEAAVLECCQRHSRGDLVEKMCAGIWKWRRQGLEPKIPTVSELERAVDS